jgi:hypothetical protein
MATVAQKVKQLVEWAPALSLLSEISAADTAKERVDGALKLMRFVATKTQTAIDDELLARTEAVLLSPQGQELFQYIVTLVTAVSFAEIDE